MAEPKSQTEPERSGSGPGGSRRPPRRTALGYSGDDQDDDDFSNRIRASLNMRKWQRMQIKIVERGLQGYKVWLLATGVFAFLKTDLEFQIGSTHDVIFDQWNKDGTASFILDTDKNVKQKENRTSKPKVEHKVKVQNFNLEDLLPLRTENFSNISKTKSQTGSTLESQCPTDFLPPPLSISEWAPLNLIQHSLNDYLDWFRENAYTGIVKCKYSHFNSFGALVLFRGRCTGAIFVQDGQDETLPTKDALPQMYKAMALLGAEVVSYTLPEQIILPISAGFIGYPYQITKENRRYNFDQIISSLKEQNSIAVLMFISKICGTTFAYVYQGETIGTFCVEEQLFTIKDEEFLDVDSNIEDVQLIIRTLPNEVVAESFQFGFELKL